MLTVTVSVFKTPLGQRRYLIHGVSKNGSYTTDNNIQPFRFRVRSQIEQQRVLTDFDEVDEQITNLFCIYVLSNYPDAVLITREIDEEHYIVH